ncbi:hypothetical protein K450DRAFT_256298 [Umbelopsis ramanniana AG]|uniref:Uncharacterized protein n=1 Tax=Umbelopsis ramanniana AG TaxID=1314678 RepID=A0AAD5E4I4_UMBRA|nr:uncharacterized protein K450DRAFT_256298 [Umbelopsis ramanniana AG]KAI8576579.1 hypothetical protein K450DRAFT_256298 [Umbelopsis ramanniana AG]
MPFNSSILVFNSPLISRQIQFLLFLFCMSSIVTVHLSSVFFFIHHTCVLMIRLCVFSFKNLYLISPQQKSVNTFCRWLQVVECRNALSDK